MITMMMMMTMVMMIIYVRLVLTVLEAAYRLTPGCRGGSQME
jgi:hypothetical protein